MNDWARHEADNRRDAERDAYTGRDHQDRGALPAPWDRPAPHEAERDRQ